MNKPLRHVWMVVAVLFLLLFGSTTYFQVIAAKSLNADGRNARTVYAEYDRHRGPIVVGGEPIAESHATDDAYGYQRTYDPGSLYAPVTGYYSVEYGFSGLEKSLNDTLSGESDALFYQRLTDTVSGRDPQGASVQLTIDPAAQRAATDALQGHRGAAVAMDPETGKVLALVSAPSYDPDDLASHSTKKVHQAWTDLNEDPDRPLTNRAIAGDLYPPGSTFKLIVAAAALDSGDYTKDTKIPGPGSFTLPQTQNTLYNHPRGDNTPCGSGGSSTLSSALQQSCNTSFAKLGISLGEDAIEKKAKEFGFGDRMEIPLSVTPSSMGKDLNDAQLATSSIGQYEDRVTPLQMAMVGSAMANDGKVMSPQLVDEVRTRDQSVISSFSAQQYSQPLSAANAAQMREMMVSTVKDGTGGAAAINGVEVGGKTGTAQWGDGRTPHSWFVGFADNGGKKVAVSVVVEQGGYGADVAAPIARNVMEAVVSK
ncbi:cell division protein FtsI [Brachybacterium endophyticum]|uniref:Cell division protein FtsI n=1 Tax=Brachybacterium endophyticum TaxID=2182385 RepID=A0A2U2RP41_9MICO|nr:penicillin-binding transpeptidase domain-containing protein [Brachybacterium endophyticum]PWH07601.1 cell division protein FtsI [Brachybacterium endophyticum]